MSDFSDRPFVAGSLTGLRAFDVDKYGRLCGPTYREVFKPGENVASCGGRSGGTHPWATGGLVASGLTFTYYPTLGDDPTVPPPPRKPRAEKPREKPKHQVGSHGCSCGYYAYFDGKNDYARSNRVSAIIEGYGVCTVGDRGFRAEKARVLALVIPQRRRSLNPFDRIPRDVYEWFYRQEGWPLAPFIIAGIGSLMGAVAGATASPWLLSLLLITVLSAAGVYVVFHALDVHYDDAVQSEPSFAKVHKNYPDVPVYRTQRAALRAHPVSIPEGLIPTPDDEDFWTRSVTS